MERILRRLTKGSFMLFAVGAMVLGSAIPQAFAGKDGKKYPGWMCRAENSAAAKFLHYHYEGGITNTHTSVTYNVVCPIVRDTFYRGMDSDHRFKGIDHATIHFLDNHPAARLKCTIASRFGRSMKLIGSASNQSPVGRASSFFHIKGPKKVLGYATVMQAYYIMRCSLPPKTSHGRSILQSYYVEEIDD